MHTPPKEIDPNTSADWDCGCKLALKKTCDCKNPAQLDYTQCRLHEAAPQLLEALEKLTTAVSQVAPTGKNSRLLVAAYQQARAAIDAAKETG